MTRTRTITTTLLTAVAALVTLGGCSSQDNTGRCVDANGNLLPDSACQSAGGGGGVYYGGGGGYRNYNYPHRVYGGTVSGGRVTGFSSSPSSSGGIFRGGFGFHGFGGGSHGGGE